MAKVDMRQPGTDFGEKGETGESIPASVKSSDSSGERAVKMNRGVGMGKADMTGSASNGVGRSGHGQHDGRLGEFKGHKGESVVYSHIRVPHEQDGM